MPAKRGVASSTLLTTSVLMRSQLSQPTPTPTPTDTDDDNNHDDDDSARFTR